VIERSLRLLRIGRNPAEGGVRSASSPRESEQPPPTHWPDEGLEAALGQTARSRQTAPALALENHTPNRSGPADRARLQPWQTNSSL
jgi:hypothetical protein